MRLRILAAVCLLVPWSAFAATATTTFNVTATVTSSCSVSATNVAFGSVAPLSSTTYTAQGTISATCTNGTSYTLALSAGSGAYTARTMSDGTDTLTYNLYTDTTYGTVWGDGTGATATVGPLTGTGSAVSTTVYGQMVMPQSTAGPGSYSDTITVTLSYT